METIIISWLAFLSGLILYERLFKKRRDSGTPKQGSKQQPTDVMGKPKITGHNRPTVSHERQSGKHKGDVISFEEDFEWQVPQEEPDEDSGSMPDLDEEEREWQGYGHYDSEPGFATGVTFEELSTAGMALGLSGPEPALERQAVATILKIQGTELLRLLESSMPDASQKIAKLLEKGLNDPSKGSSFLRNDNTERFDINDFI